MALYTVKEKFKVYKGEKSAEPKYRKELSGLIIKDFGKGPFSQEEITSIIRFCLNYYIEKFTAICHQESTFYFYQSVLHFHEDATELAVLNRGVTNHSIITGEYLAFYRRVLKFILELGCEVNMRIVVPTKADRPRLEKVLDDLLFLGDMILMCVSIYAEQSMVEDVGELEFDKDDLYVFSRRHHYNFIFDHISNTWGHNVEKVVIDDNGIDDLFNAMQRCLNVNYKDAGHIIASIHQEIHFSEGVLWENLPQNLSRLFGTPYADCEVFFKGLTLSKDNKMSLLNLACKPYNLKRYLYRPIIVWNINGKDFAVIGPNAWAETMIQFTTNAIPWGKGPEEWMQNQCFERYVHDKEDQHDKWFDDAVEDILKTTHCYYDRNVIKLVNKTGFINVDIPGLGEVDFIIIAPHLKKILIVDCKHLMSRYDSANQKNDYNAFTKGSKKTKSYNETMKAKVKWFSDNMDLIREHFLIKGNLALLDISGYSCEGVFFINTPTLYMYNADFRIYVLGSVKKLIDGNYQDTEFLFHIESEDSVQLIKVPYPYLKKPKLFNIDLFDDDEEFVP